MPKRRPALLDSKVYPKAMRAMSRLQTSLYRASGGRLGGKYRMGAAFPGGLDVCLLTTTGRKSGEPRTVPLVYLEDGDRVVLTASQSGLPRHPNWYLNLTANPEVTIRVGRTERRMRARTAAGPERDKLWSEFVELNSDMSDYAAWTDREIPVVICEPVS